MLSNWTDLDLMLVQSALNTYVKLRFISTTLKQDKKTVSNFYIEVPDGSGDLTSGV